MRPTVNGKSSASLSKTGLPQFSDSPLSYLREYWTWSIAFLRRSPMTGSKLLPTCG